MIPWSSSSAIYYEKVLILWAVKGLGATLQHCIYTPHLRNSIPLLFVEPSSKVESQNYMFRSWTWIMEACDAVLVWSCAMCLCLWERFSCYSSRTNTRGVGIRHALLDELRWFYCVYKFIIAPFRHLLEHLWALWWLLQGFSFDLLFLALCLTKIRASSLQPYHLHFKCTHICQLKHLIHGVLRKELMRQILMVNKIMVL